MNDATTPALVSALRTAVADRTLARKKAAGMEVARLRLAWDDPAGTSRGYKAAVSAAYLAAGVPSDPASGFQANLRYHTGNALRLLMPADRLVAAGLDTDGPAARARRTRAAAAAVPVTAETLVDEARRLLAAAAAMLGKAA